MDPTYRHTQSTAVRVETLNAIGPRDVAVARIRVLALGVAAVLAAIDAWAGRHEMTHDGISYLDMSDALLRGDWAGAVNGHWSPLYSWLLAAGRSIAGTGAQGEFPVVHAVNFVVFLAALIAFDFLLRELAPLSKGCGCRQCARMGRCERGLRDLLVVVIEPDRYRVCGA